MEASSFDLPGIVVVLTVCLMDEVDVTAVDSGKFKVDAMVCIAT